MTDIAKFNIGGHRDEVLRPLLESHPDPMLANSASDQCSTTKRKKETNHSTPGSPAFDPSRYTYEELEDAMKESKRVCIEMQRREEARIYEITNRLFESDDDEETIPLKNTQMVPRTVWNTSGERESSSDEDSIDGPNDDEEYISA